MNRSMLLRAVMLGLLSVSVKAMVPVQAEPFLRIFAAPPARWI